MALRSVVLVGALIIACSVSLARAQSRPAPPADQAMSATTPAPDPRHVLGEPMWIAGLAVLATTYVATGVATSILVAIANTRLTTIGESWVPVVGPWVMLADSRGFDVSQIALTAASAVLQSLGCVALILGLVLDGQASHATPTAGVRVLPVVGAQGGGLSIAGWF